MPTEVYAANLGEVRALSTAGGGTALSTTATYIPIPRNVYHLYITPRNFATAVVAQASINPYLTVLKTTDNMATLPTDYSNQAQDGVATTHVALSSLDTLANGDFLLIGAAQPFRGVYVDMDAAVNGTASVLTVTYRKSDDTWADTSATDNTASGGATFAVDGLVTWTVPTDWKTARLVDIYTSVPKDFITIKPLYWTRWAVSVALDSSVDVDAMLCANRSTAYPEYLSGQCWEQRVFVGQGGVGCVEAKVNAGTGNLIVNGATEHNGGF